jgi:tetratricopeptide (TPR) repeat protein
MSRIILLIAGIAVLAACARYSGGESAGKRAERLNASKAEARSLVDAGQWEKAVAVLEPLCKEATGDEQLFVMLGESYNAVGRTADAVAAFESAIRLAYRDYYAHLKLANLLMETGRTGRALTEYELAAQFGEMDPVTRHNYGLALHEMGRPDRALEEWKAAYRIESDNPRYAEAVGIGLTRQNPAEAVTWFEKAGELGAGGASYHNNFGLALQRSGDRRRTASEFAEAVRVAPGDEEYRFNLAAAYMNMGAFREAITEWDTLIVQFGERWSYTVYRGRALLELGRYAEAIAAAEPILAEYDSGDLAAAGDRLDRTPPDRGEALEVLAMSYRGQGDLQRALGLIRDAVEAGPSNVSFLNNYGVILAESGSIDLAKSQWKRVLEIDADNAAARKNLSAMEP